jgi:hypothetical protein
LCLTRCRRKRASSRSPADLGIGKPDRRHQVPPPQSRESRASRSCPSCRQAAPGPLTFCASAISTDQPSASSVSWTILAPVIDSTTAETGSRVHLVDPARQPAQRIHVGRHGEPVEPLSRIAEQTDVELLPAQIESSVQHMQRASLGARIVDTAERLTNEGAPPHGSPNQARRAASRVLAYQALPGMMGALNVRNTLQSSSTSRYRPTEPPLCFPDRCVSTSPVGRAGVRSAVPSAGRRS